MEDDRNDGVQSSTGDAGNGLNLEALFNTSMATPFWVAVFFILASFVIFKKRSSVAGPFVFRDLSGYLTTVRGMFQSARNAQSSKSTSTASSGSDSEGSALITASETSTAAISSSSSTDSMVISSSTDSMVVQDSGLLHLPLQIIARIANGLDARSLIHLASSCRLLHRFLRQPSRRNGVEVQISFPVLFRVAWDLREKLEIWPFACHIDWLMTSPDTFHGDLECLRRIHAKTIEKVEPRDGGLVDYQDLRNMIIIGSSTSRRCI